MHEPERCEPQRCDTDRWSQKALLLALGVVLVLLALTPVLRPDQRAQQPPAASAQLAPARLADFGGAAPSPDARLLANWVLTTRDHGQHAFMLVDKKDARVYVFTPEGRLQDSAPVLLGEAHGDDILPGAAEKEPSELTPEEKTTPAGRFEAEAGVNADGEDVIWVDYDAAISMHRLRATDAAERRPERLASPAADDNRISYGCINLPAAFYDAVAEPAVKKHGAVIYVLPEAKTLQQVFGAWDVTDPAQVAAARKPAKTSVS